MQTPAQIVFHGIDHSDAIEQRIQEKIGKLEKYYKDITACRVVVEYHHKTTAQDQKPGGPFLATVNITVPGEELVARSDRGDDPDMLKNHEDMIAALRDAFASMERQLKTLADKRRSEHRVPTH